MLVEVIGYIGMIVVVSSFLFKNIKKVRIVNICGAILSATYGFLTWTLPTAILNCVLITVNVIMLIKNENTNI